MGYKDDYEAAKANGSAERLTPSKVQFNEGDLFVGKYIEREVVKSTKKGFGDSYRYSFDTDDGVATIFFSQSFDNGVGAELEQGEVYSFEYVEKVKLAENRTWKKIDVHHITSAAPTVDTPLDDNPINDSD